MHRLILLICTLFLMSSTFSQDYSSRVFPMAESSLLWKVTGDSIHDNTYIFGTIHLIPQSKYYFPDTLLSINKNVDVVMLEVDLSVNMGGLMDKLILEEGSFFDFFSKEQTDSIILWAEKNLEMTESQMRMTFGKMKPFVVSTMASAMGTDEPVESYDMNISENAKKADIEILGLESFEEQISMFDNYSNEEQAEMLMASIRDDEKTIEMQNEMIDLYLGQNIDSLFIFATTDGAHSLDQTIFLDDRNKKWVPQIEDQIKKKNVLIAVGAGHLGGENGLIRLLEKKGYTLTPIKL